MDLKSGYPFWAVKNGLMHAFPPLRSDLQCEVAVVGGGLTGALVAHELAANGHAVAVLEQLDIGWGSTAASTALVQYEIDTPLTELAHLLGEADAVRVYRACVDAIDRVAEVARAVRDIGFARYDSLYYASRRWHRRSLHAEYLIRAHHGLPVAWLERAALRERFGFDAPAAILSATAARLDPYRLAIRLLQRLQRDGVPVYDRSCVTRIVPGSRGVALHTQPGPVVRATHVVLATGYAAQQWIKQRVAYNRSSYAVATDPVESDLLGPLARTLVWETARPYLYLRTTDDGRLLVGGEDDAVDVPARRDHRVERKARALLRRVQKLWPHLALQPNFAWAGTFAETRDGLPFFGPHEQHGPRVHFAMAYGGNGITYSILGAELLRARIERRRHPLAELFGFARRAR